MVVVSCAYHTPALVDFVPEYCTDAACETQRSAIRKCPLILSESNTQCKGGMCSNATNRLR